MPVAELHRLHPARNLIRARRGRPVLALLLLAGCYTYRPLSAPAPAAGTRVQVSLTDAGSDSLAARIGPGIEQIAGEVIRSDSAALTLGVREVEGARGQQTDWEGETVEVPRRFIRELEARHLSLGGTGLLGGAIAAGLVAATEAFGGAGSVEGGGNGTGAPGDR